MANVYVYCNKTAFYESHPAARLVLAAALPVASLHTGAQGEGCDLRGGV